MTITCEGSATSKPTGLPADFPHPDAVTYVNATKSGPTVIVDGHSTESLEGMYAESCANGNVSVHITNRPSD